MKKILSILITSYKNYTVYFTDIIGTNIILVLRIIFLTTLYGYIFKNYGASGNISGYTLVQLSYAVIIAQVISTAKPKITAEIQLDVKSGKIAAYLLNPINYVTFKFLEYFPIFLYNVFIGLILGFSIGYLLLGTFPLTIGGLIGGTVLLFGSMFTVFFGYMIVGLASFYMEDNEAFRFIYSKLDMVLGGNLIPIPFLPNVFQVIAYASPFAYFGYTTGLIFSSFEFDKFLKYLVIQTIWLIINISICIFMYNHAKNKLTINGG